MTQPAIDPKNFAILVQLMQMAKVPEAEQQAIFNQPTALIGRLNTELETVHTAFGALEEQRQKLKAENETYAQEKKRNHEEFVGKQTKIAETLASSYPEGRRPQVLSLATKLLTDPEYKDHHELVTDALTGFATLGQQQQQQQQIPDQGFTMPVVTEMGVTASAQQAKRPAQARQVSSAFASFTRGILASKPE